MAPTVASTAPPAIMAALDAVIHPAPVRLYRSEGGARMAFRFIHDRAALRGDRGFRTLHGRSSIRRRRLCRPCGNIRFRLPCGSDHFLHPISGHVDGFLIARFQRVTKFIMIDRNQTFRPLQLKLMRIAGDDAVKFRRSENLISIGKGNGRSGLRRRSSTGSCRFFAQQF